MALDTFGEGTGWLKAGFFGFPKSGKTWTAALLAVELRSRLNLTGPVAIYDTEGGGEYIAPMLQRATGQMPIGKRSRNLADLLAVGRECEAGAASVLIADSITHPWREVCDAYLSQVNAARERQGKSPRMRLEFQDWANIKAKWSVWTDFFLNSRLHIIICGRAGYEWEFEEVEDDRGEIRKELRKVGTKMKVEAEFGFEPSLLVEMERVQVPDENAKDRFTFTHRARVLGDRFGVLDAAVCDNPTGAFFGPHLDMLVPGATNFVDTSLRTDMGINESGDADYYAERREKTKLLEEIQGEMIAAWPGQKAEEKRAKVAVVDFAFGTKSWTALEGKSLAVLRAGLTKVRNFIASQTAALTPEGGE